MRGLLGTVGLGHVRYATRGNAKKEQEAQPFYVNAPYGIVLVHNGNLTNTRELTAELQTKDRRHLNTTSDTELLVNVLASELQSAGAGNTFSTDYVFDAISAVHRRVEGSYAAIALIAGHGLLAFRDPFGIRPLILGKRQAGLVGDEWIVASESLVLEASGYDIVRDVAPGEAIFIGRDGSLVSKQCATTTRLAPCSFEYVYLARPDSVMNGISVYEARLRLGEKLADTIAKHARTILEHQMKDIVAGELARLRFAEPNMGSLENVVRNALIPLVDERLHIVTAPMVKDELRKIFNNLPSC
jgi:amidophosphoribosyltransferase